MGTERMAIPKPKSSAMSVQKKVTKSPFASRRSFSESDNESTSDDFPVSRSGMELDWGNIPVDPPESTPQVQGKEETEKKDIQAKEDESVLEEEEILQTKPNLQAKDGAPETPANFESQLASHQGDGQPLSEETRSFMESRLEADFSEVRVHETPDLTNAIQAQAFTHGQDIYFNSGKYNPGSSIGKELLAHELTHVVQQNRTQAVSSVQKKPQEKSAIGYVGLNPLAWKESQALNTNSQDKILSSLDNETEHKNFDNPEKCAKFVLSILGSPSSPQKFKKVLKCLEDCDINFREQMAHMIIMFLDAERGKYKLERLVLSGHHAQGDMWGDAPTAGYLIPDRDLVNLVEAFPSAANQIEDIIFSACHSTRYVDLCKKLFPNLESIWVYDGYSPSINQGSDRHISKWERRTRGKRTPRKSDKEGNIAIWTKEDGFL